MLRLDELTHEGLYRDETPVTQCTHFVFGICSLEQKFVCVLIPVDLYIVVIVFVLNIVIYFIVILTWTYKSEIKFK